MVEKRLLAAILNADAAGFSRLMAADEAATVKNLDQCRAIFAQEIAAHGGSVVDMAGDNVLATFDSAIEALRAALLIQEQIETHARTQPEHLQMRYRIGLNLGDILLREDGTVYGDGVNVAARLQALATPGELCISGSVHDLAAGALNLNAEDLGPQTVKNITRPIQAWRVPAAGGDGPSDTASSDAAAIRRPSDPSGRSRSTHRMRPSIAVLPFENIGGDQEQEYLAEGIAEDIITELSRLRSLMVIARNSAFAFRASQAPLKEIAEQLGARFVVHGSVRRGGNRARITAELVDVETGAQLWAERYDREIDDMFAIQDEIAQKILSILPSRIEDAELRRSRNKPTENLAAYEYLLRAKFHHHKGTAEDNATGLELIDKAIELDPEYAQAYAWKACLMGQALVRGYGESSTALADMMGNLDRALRIDEDDFETHRILSGVRLVQRDYDRAIFHAARAQDLNPNDPRVMSQYGEILTAHGNADEAIVILENALQVDPYKPDRRLTHLGVAQFVAGRYADAIATFNQISALQLDHHIYLAACHAQLGNSGQARHHAQEVRRLKPDFDLREYVYQLAYKHDADREHHREALIRAGLGAGA